MTDQPRTWHYGLVAQSWTEFDFDSEAGMTEDNSTIASVQGLVFNGDLLYVAIDGQVNVGFLATVVTTIPEGVALSPTGASIHRCFRRGSPRFPIAGEWRRACPLEKRGRQKCQLSEIYPQVEAINHQGKG